MALQPDTGLLLKDNKINKRVKETDRLRRNFQTFLRQKVAVLSEDSTSF